MVGQHPLPPCLAAGAGQAAQVGGRCGAQQQGPAAGRPAEDHAPAGQRPGAHYPLQCIYRGLGPSFFRGSAALLAGACGLAAESGKLPPLQLLPGNIGIGMQPEDPCFDKFSPDMTVFWIDTAGG